LIETQAPVACIQIVNDGYTSQDRWLCAHSTARQPRGWSRNRDRCAYLVYRAGIEAARSSSRLPNCGRP
jgi:hypothetical protein